jgi:hypothetical protein
MDGTLDTSNDLWRSSVGPATPVGLDLTGNPMCPLCARKVQSERLEIVSGTELFGCRRGHRFQLRGLSM